MRAIAQLFLLIFFQTAAPVPSDLQSLTSADTFESAQISKAAQAQIAEMLEGSSADWDRARMAQLRARRVLLTPGKKDGLAVLSTASADCGATGNCFFSILQQAGDGWKVLLPDATIDGFAITKDVHNGLYDVKLSANQSAETSMISVMEFNGTEYHARHCFKVNEKGGSKQSASIPCPTERAE